MRIPSSVIDNILSLVSMEDIVSEYVSLEHKGSSIVGCCPFHSEKTPSFSITPDKNLYYCFGCGKGGNILNFIQELENINFVESVEYLANKVGVNIDINNSDHQVDRNFEAYINLYDVVNTHFKDNMKNRDFSAPIKKYLDGRGLSDEVIKEFEIGFSLPTRNYLHRFLLDKKYSAKFLQDSGIFSKNYENITLFSNRIMFPIRNRKGQVIAFGGRLFSGEGPKYINTGETEYYKKKENFYSCSTAISEIRKSGFFYIVEGYMDVIAFYRAGIKNVIAPLGTAFTEEQSKILSKYAKKAIVVFDGDKAGINAAIKTIFILEKNGIHSKIVTIPEGQDPDDIVNNEGVSSFRNMLKNKKNNLTFLIENQILRYDVKTPEGKNSVVNEVFQFIKLLDTETKRAAALQILAEHMKLNETAIINDFYSNGFSEIKKVEKIEKKSYVQSSELKIDNNRETFLMIAVSIYPDYFKEVRKYIGYEDLSDHVASEMFLAFEECYRKGKMTNFFVELNDSNLVNLILKKVNSGEFGISEEQFLDGDADTNREEVKVNRDQLLNDLLTQLRIDIYERKSDKIQRELNNINLNHQKVLSLVQEKLDLENDLKKIK